MSLLSRLFNFLTGKKSPEPIIYDLMASSKTMEGDFLCLRYLIRHCEENSGDHASFRALDSFLKHTWKSKLSPEDLFCAGVRLAEEAASLSFNGDVYSMVLRHGGDYIDGGKSSLTPETPRSRASSVESCDTAKATRQVGRSFAHDGFKVRLSGKCCLTV